MRCVPPVCARDVSVGDSLARYPWSFSLQSLCSTKTNARKILLYRMGAPCDRRLDIILMKVPHDPFQHRRIHQAWRVVLSILKESLRGMANASVLAEHDLDVNVPCDGYGEL